MKWKSPRQRRVSEFPRAVLTEALQHCGGVCPVNGGVIVLSLQLKKDKQVKPRKKVKAESWFRGLYNEDDREWKADIE